MRRTLLEVSDLLGKKVSGHSGLGGGSFHTILQI